MCFADARVFVVSSEMPNTHVTKQFVYAKEMNCIKLYYPQQEQSVPQKQPINISQSVLEG